MFPEFCRRVLPGALIMVMAGPGQAFFAPGCPCGAVSGYHSDTRSHVTEETTEAAAVIVEAMRAQTLQLSAYLDRQVEAIKRIEDAGQQNDTQRLRESIRAAAESGEFDPNPDSCLQYDLIGEELDLPVTSRELIMPVEEWSRGEAEPVRVGGMRLGAWLMQEKDHLETVTGRENPTTDWGSVLDEPTVDVEAGESSRAISRLVTNTIDPAPPAPLPDHELKTPAGISRAIVRDARSARLGAAMELIEYSLEMRVPTTESVRYRSVASASGYERDIPDLISELQKLDIRTSFYANPTADTLDLRQTKNVTALLQDLVDIAALNARINLQMLEFANREAIVDAAILALLLENGPDGR